LLSGHVDFDPLGEIFTRPILQTPPASVANAGTEP
jgi:hypothetical protein